MLVTEMAKCQPRIWLDKMFSVPSASMQRQSVGIVTDWKQQTLRILQEPSNEGKTHDKLIKVADVDLQLSNKCTHNLG